MFKISDATKAFSSLDQLGEDDTAKLDKALRHLSQRVTFPAFAREGRADLYTHDAICALRLLHKASAFGLERSRVEELSLWMQERPVGPARRVPVDDGFRAMSRIEEGIDRATAGEDFDFIMVLRASGGVDIETNWLSDDQESSEKVDDIFAAAGLSSESEKHRNDVRFILPASCLLAELVKVLGA